MVRIRSTSAALLLLAAVASFDNARANSPSPASTLSGVVRDEVGKVMEGVEVLVLSPEGHGGDALLRAVSDGGGRFLLALSPGVYRVAAIKTGYVAALGRVNTVLHSSIDLVLRPIPKAGQPGAEKVQDDLSWTLRVPPRSVLRELRAGSVVASRATGGARAFATRVQESVRGEVDQVFAVGSFRPGGADSASNLTGNETRMRFAGSLGDRGAIQLRGRRGVLDSTSSPTTTTAVSRGASDVDVDVSYATAADENLAMRAFYSTGDLLVDQRWVGSGPAARQSQRSFGYDASWRKQVDASSHVALQVGFQGAGLDAGPAPPAVTTWEAPGEAWNRGIGAAGSYENLVSDNHLLRVDFQTRRLSLEAPSLRVSGDNGGLALEGPTGWNLLVDTEDQWSLAGPVSLAYGLTVRQGFDDGERTALTPRVGASLNTGRIEGRVAMSYFAGLPEERDPAAPVSVSRSPVGYDAELKARLDPTTSLAGSFSYVPWRADVIADDRSRLSGLDALYVSDGFSSDRFVSVGLEHLTSSAVVAFRVGRGRAEGSVAPALDEAPIVLLFDRALDYGTARLSVKAPRAGSAVSLGYRETRDHGVSPVSGSAYSLRTVDMEFSQDLVRFSGGRASCRFLMTAKTALRPGASESAPPPVDARINAVDKRIGAGVSLAF